MTRKRIRRFKETRRASISFWIILVLYGLSLCSEFICNNIPIYIRFNGSSYFPVIKFYSEDTFIHNGKKTRPDYKKLATLPEFADGSGNLIIFPPVPFGPFESIEPKSIPITDAVTVRLIPVPLTGSVNITRNGSISQTLSFEAFTGKREEELIGRLLSDFFSLPEEIQEGIENRFKNLESARLTGEIKSHDGREIRVSLSTFMSRKTAPQTVRLTFMEITDSKLGKELLVINRKGEPDPVSSTPSYKILWNSVRKEDRETLIMQAKNRFLGPVDTLVIPIEGRPFRIEMDKEEVRFPYPPVAGHLMGIDGAGRDVFARILYGLRTSLTFGLFLVVCSMAFGIAAGAIQGYFGGIIDISAQRFIEIWSALPFLYIMILMGSTYGRGFSILLLCYGIFNWIGISYYIRAEFLRLRTQGFVEAAKCMGFSSGKIIFRHILPNALIPVITFFPFLLVGAIGALAALDYLGFGLPPPTPSWGELLFQAQQYRWAWWLILYPSSALFLVMLLGVFVGEGVRNAYDPKQYTRLE